MQRWAKYNTLHETGGYALQDVQLDRKHGAVKIKKVLLAKFDNNDVVKYEEAAACVKEAVDKHMTEWLAKRAKQ